MEGHLTEMQQHATLFGKALYYLIRPTWMLALSQLLFASYPLITFLILLHFGRINLMATGIGIVVCNFTGLSIILAMSVACDELSLCNKTLKDAVIMVQRSLFICLLTISFISWTFWMNAGSILSALGFNLDVAGFSEEFAFSFLPGFILFVLATFLQRYMYLVNGEAILPLLICNLITAIVHGILTGIFEFNLQLGVRGAAYSLNLSYLMLTILLFLALMWQEEYRSAWTGWSWECLKGHGSYLKLVSPYVIVVAMEWWTFDAGIFIVGALNENDLPTQLIIVLLLEFLCMITHQFTIGASAQIEDAVRGGYWKRAVFILKCSMLLTWIFSILCGALLSGIEIFFSSTFTDHWRIVLTTAEIIILIAPIPFFRGTQALGFHVLRRFERKKLPVIIAGVGYWVVSLPASLVLIYFGKRGIQGFWIGYLLGAFIQAVVFLTLLYHKMRQWIEKQESVGDGAPVTPSGQFNSSPFEFQDAVDGKRKSSIVIEHPRIHMRFNSVEISRDYHTEETSAPQVVAFSRPSKRTVIIRVLTVSFCACVFVTGIVFRFFVPGAHEGHDHGI